MKRIISIASILAILVTLVVSTPTIAEETVIHVPADYATIQGAINAASPGDTVQVAAGTYNENIKLKDGVRVSGSGAESTILNWVYNTDDYGVVNAWYVGSTTIFEGFTVRDGYSHGLSGAGINIKFASPIIRNNIICNNDGLAIFTGGASTPRIENNIIVNNKGGISVYASQPIITGNVITENRRSGYYGEGCGILTGNTETFTIANNIITYNIFGIQMLLPSGGEAKVINNTIAENTYAGLFSNNSSSLSFVNNIIVDNPKYGIFFESYHYQGNPKSDNNNVWNNSEVDYGGIATPGVNDISEDPKFVDSTNSNYHLRYDSPCIDAGNNIEVPTFLVKDFDGDSRILDGNKDGNFIVDIGADEYVLLIADVVIEPDSIQLAKAGQFITAYIELPESYDINLVDISSIHLNKIIPAVTDLKYDFVSKPKLYITDIDHDKIPERMVKFNTEDVKQYLFAGENEFVVSGIINTPPDITYFIGSDSMEVVGFVQIDVYPGESINEAIKKANPGDTVYVHAGTYHEAVIFKGDEKRILLKGESVDNTILDGTDLTTPSNGITIEDLADNIVVEGFTIQNFTTGVMIGGTENDINNVEVKNNNGGILVLGNNNKIHNNLINNCIGGIVLWQSDNNQIFGNIIEDSKVHGVPPPAGIVVGIFSEDNLIKGNTIHNIRCDDLNANGDEIAGGAIGVNGDNNYIVSNDISDCENGISSAGTDNTITENTITGSTTHAIGIYLPASNNLVDKNTISYSWISIGMGGSNNHISNNTITHSTFKGISIWKDATFNLFTGNDISQCATGIGVGGRNNSIQENHVDICETGIGIYGVWDNGVLVDNTTGNEITHNVVTASKYNGIFLGLGADSNFVKENEITNIKNDDDSGVCIAIMGNENYIEENTVSDCDLGVNIGGSNNLISGNNFEGSTNFGINTFGLASGNLIESNNVSSVQGTGIFIGGTNQDVQENHVVNCKWGIAVGSKSSNIVRNTVEYCNDQGIGIWTGDWGVPELNLIDENNISNCAIGIGSGGLTNNISNNTITHTTLHGISIWPGSNFNMIDGNQISYVENELDDGIGISILGDNNTIQNNSAFYCDMYGIAAYPLADDNIIQWNTVLHNGISDLYAYIPGNNVWIDNIFDTKNW